MLGYWLRAEEPPVLAADYASMAPALGLDSGISDQTALIAAIRGKLERTDRWLLVFDNAGEPGSLDPYLPRSGGGHVLITSRWQEWDGTAEALELAVPSEPEAVALLLGGAAADAAQRAASAELAHELGRLPLALAQARAFMRARTVDIAGYRQQLAVARPKVLAWRPPHASYPLAMAQAWQASLDHAAHDCPAAPEVLQLLAFLGPDAIPRDLLGAKPEALPKGLSDPFDRDSAIEALGRFSLVRVEPDSLTVHRLVQAVTREGLDEPTSGRCATIVVALVDAALPRPARERAAPTPVVGRLLPHALAAAGAAERLGVGLVVAGRILSDLGAYLMAGAARFEAEPLLRRAIAVRERAMGPEHPDLAIPIDNLARLYAGTGRPAEAEPLFQRTLAIREQALGPEHLAVAESFGCLGLFYRGEGRSAKAQPLFERAIATYERTPDAEYPDLAFSLHHRAWLYEATDRHAKAEPLHQRARAIREQALGPEHPDFATSLATLARLYEVTGRHAEAEPLHQRALAIRERILGPVHPDFALSLSNLGMLYLDTGRYVDAEPLLQRALAIHERTLGPEHPRIGVSLYRLADVYINGGRFAEAEPLLQRALAIYEQALGPEHPNVGGSLYQLAVVFVSTSRSAEAEPLLQRCLAIQVRNLGSEHRFVGGSLYRLAQVYLDTDRSAEAEPLLYRALAIHEQRYGPEHIYVSGPLSALGRLYREAGRFAEAEPLLQRCLEIIEKAPQPGHPHLVSVLDNYAALLEQIGRSEEASELRVKAEAIQQHGQTPLAPL
jgi:tetratricopeptide (TPR) repeat protein